MLVSNLLRTVVPVWAGVITGVCLCAQPILADESALLESVDHAGIISRWDEHSLELQRLRYTGKPVKLLDDVKVRTDGLSLRFNFELDRAAALDPANYNLEQWNYLWTSNYGSDQYSAEHPGQKGHDRLNITAIKPSEDGRQVFLTIPGLRPVNQVEIRLALTAKDSAPFKELAYLTINAVPDK